MITPVIIKILFYISVALSIIAGLVVFFGGIVTAFTDNNFWMALGGLIGGPVVIVLGVVLSRLYCELLILWFQIHSTLVEIKEELKKA